MSAAATSSLPRGLLLEAAVFGPLRLSPGRTLLAVLAIALGLAMGMAIYLINRTAADEVSLAARSLFGVADFTVAGTSAGFDEMLYPTIARWPGVELASPVVEVEARLAAGRGTLTLLGIDPFRAFRMLPPLGEPTEGARGSVFEDRAVFLSPAAARLLDLEVGDSLALQRGLEAVPFAVAGLLPGAAYPQPVAVADIADVQWLFERLGRLTRIDIRLAPGADREAMREAIAAHLPASVTIESPGEQTDEALRLSRAYRANLTALALVALFTGAFLVYATQSLAVVRRRRELALLHAIGVTGREQVLLSLACGAVVGVFGALLGVAGGIGTAHLGLEAFGADLGAGYFRGIAPQLDVHPLECLAFFVLGLGVAVIGAVRPALEAAAVPPAAALKSGDVLEMRYGHALAGTVLLIVAAFCLTLPPLAGLPLPGYLAIALTLIGVIALMPIVTRGVVRHLPEGGPAALEVAVAHLRGTAPQITVSISAVLVSFSLMAAMAIMVASFRGSLADWLDKVLPGDVYVRAGYTGDTAFLDPGSLERIAALPGVARIEASRFRDVVLADGAGPLTLVARPIAPERARDTLWIETQARAPLPAHTAPAWLSESAADLYALDPDDTFELVLDGRTVTLSVRGTFRDYERQLGAIVIDRELYRELTTDASVNTAWLWLDPGVDPQEIVHEVRAQLPQDAAFDVRLPAEIRALSLRIFDRTFAVTYVLEAIAVLIGLFGISSSMSAQVLARRAEFGMLRHVGFTRGQVAAMLAIEGGMLGVVGVVAGLVVGWAVSLILIYVVNRQSFHWSMDLHIPAGLLAALCGVLIAAAALTSMLSGRQAMTGDTARAVREDW